MGYILNSPVPSITNYGTVIEGVSNSSDRAVWRDAYGSGDFHFFGGFGGDGSIEGSDAVYINLSTGVTAFMTGVSIGSIGGYAWNPATGKLYGGTGYANHNDASFFEFDPDTQTLTLLRDADLAYPIGGAVIGDDGRVYQYLQGGQLMSYDTNVGMPSGLLLYNIPLATSQIYRALGVDANYVYMAVRKTNNSFTLFITPVGDVDGWTEWEFGAAGDTNITIERNVGNFVLYLTRTLADTSVKRYYLSGGTYTETGDSLTGENQTKVSPYCYYGKNATAYGWYEWYFGWQLDMTDYIPVKGTQESSIIKYRQVWIIDKDHYISPTPDYITADIAYGGSFVPMAAITTVPISDTAVISFPPGYGSVASLDIHSSATYLGVAGLLSAYESVKDATGEVYIAGYANLVMRYDPALPWTLNNGNTAPKLPSDPSKPNPYFMQKSGDVYDYFHCVDYDANGIIWFGCNTTRSPNPPGHDYGNVMWYDPSDGSTGFLFDSWKTPGVLFRNLCAAANRSKIVVTANDGNLYVIDAATKTLDGSYSLGTYAYIVDVNGVVVGVVPEGVPLASNVFRFDPLTRTMLTGPQAFGGGVTGVPFGYGNTQYTRMYYRLEKGPDDYVWLFVGNSLYRVNSDTLVFSKVADTTYGKIRFAYNNLDLLVYYINGTTDFKYYAGILEFTQSYSRGDYASLPTDDADLENPYTADDVAAVATVDGVRVAQSAPSQYAIHEFKNDASGKSSCTVTWTGQTTLGNTTDYPTIMEIYNTTTGWEELDRDTDALANTNFTLSFPILSGLDNYKDTNGIITCRVYQSSISR